MNSFCSRQGFILIIVLGLLGVLAFLALQFAQMASTSVKLSTHHMHHCRARLAARSGLEKAVTAIRVYGWWIQSEANTPFEQQLHSAGDDRNRNGLEDPGEDVPADGFSARADLDHDLTPSFALAEDVAAPAPVSRVFTLDGKPRGLSWVDSIQAPAVASALQIENPCVDLNLGIRAGKGASGISYQGAFGTAYAEADITHPFNAPLVAFLNAWGHYHKYRAMVRPDKTYDYTKPIDDVRNLAGPYDRFDQGDIVIGGVSKTEPRLGKVLVAARPASGFSSMEEPLRILDDYITSWQDFGGRRQDGFGVDASRWKRTDGSLIDKVSAESRSAIRLAFIRLFSVGGTPVSEPWLAGGANDYPSPDTYRGGNRGGMYIRVFQREAIPFDVNSADENTLASTIAATPSGYLAQCENLRYHSEYGGGLSCLPNAPSFSMTDSIRLAQDLISFRKTSPFATQRELAVLIRSWKRGYDAKRAGTNTSHTLSSLIRNFEDYFYGVRMFNLAYLLNPHINSNSLVWDEAQPSTNKTLTGLLSQLPAPNLVYGGRWSDPQKSIGESRGGGGTFRTSSPRHSIRSQGISMSTQGTILGKLTIQANVENVRELDCHLQSEFTAAAKDPVTQVSTLGDWVSYPESPAQPPAKWDGQLALKPKLTLSTYGSGAPKLRAKLCAYDHDINGTTPPGLWPTGPRILDGPDENPARGKLANSLNPLPGAPIPPLLGSSYAQLTTLSDLLPGGGVRVSPDWNLTKINDVEFINEMSANPIHTWSRGEALLVFDNANSSDAHNTATPSPSIDLTGLPKVLPNFHEGAVSFYFKPRFVFKSESSSRFQQDVLFCAPFTVFDEGAGDLCLGAGMSAEEADLRSWFMGQIRLSWGVNEAAGQLSDLSTHFFLSTRGLLGGDGRFGYLPEANMPASFGTTPFLNNNSFVSGGDGFDGHWGRSNPYAEEKLQVEFRITKYSGNAFAGIDGSSTVPINDPTFLIWDASDAPSLTARSSAYVQPANASLNLLDNSDPLPSAWGYKSVRKVFVLSHPFNFSSGADRGKGPRNSRGDHQSMLAPGRWNHLLLVWRNLFDLLGTTPGHMGGCLAVYLNGAFQKTSGGFTFAGLYLPSGAFKVPHAGPFSLEGDTMPSFNYHFGLTGRESSRKELIHNRFPPRLYFGCEPFSCSNKVNLFQDLRMPYVPGNLTWGAFMDIQVFAAANSSLFAPQGGFIPTLPGWTTFSPYPNDTTSQPLKLFPLSLLDKRELAKVKVVGVSWNAHLPEYHQFWDDQNAATAGPDPTDAQGLLCFVVSKNIAVGFLKESQDPNAAGLTSSWSTLIPLSTAEPADFRLDVTFKGPQVTMSTPLIESVNVMLMSLEPKYLSFSME